MSVINCTDFIIGPVTRGNASFPRTIHSIGLSFAPIVLRIRNCTNAIKVIGRSLYVPMDFVLAKVFIT